MTKTARRRWSKEFSGEIDGIALGDTGPVFLHGYDPPAGGKWIDDVIPGKLAAYDRGNGEPLWVSPCEVGYGRGFGSGLGRDDDVVVLGPSIKGHRIVRMSLGTGELLGMREIKAFDHALVFGDMCVTCTSTRVAGLMTTEMLEVWSHSRSGERYHIVARSGDVVLTVYTDTNRKRQGVLKLDIETGKLLGTFLEPEFPVIHDLVCEDGIAILLAGDRSPTRYREATGPENLMFAAFRTDAESGAYALWKEAAADDSHDDMPDVSISIDSGKLYIVHGALLEVRDALSGRQLGELTLPGLDERVGWQVCQGAGLLAEETRASVFELPV